TPTITRTPSTGTPLITSSTELPAAVGELRVTPGDGRLDINWVAPDPGQGGRAAATSYRVRFSTDASSWTALPSTIVTSASIDGLANGSVVYVDVAAVNIAGTGPATSTSGVPAASASAPRGPGQQGPSTAGATVTAAITADAPVAYWPMTDPNSATSATSLAGGGALSGGVSLGFSGPIAGSSAAYVAGVAMPTTAEVNETFTFSAMIDPAVAGGDNAVLVSAGDHANGFEFRLGDRGALQFVGHRDGRATMVATAPGAIAQGSWQHVAVVVDVDSVSIIVDGSVMVTGTVPHGGGLVSFGSSADGNSFRGWISHAAVFDSALAPSRLAAHWAATGYSSPSGDTPVVRSGDGYLLVNWATPTNDGGSRIIGYQIDARVAGGDWITAVPNTFSSSTTAMITATDRLNIVNGTAYEIRVRAITEVGAGASSQVVSGTPRGAATSPTSFAVSSTGSGALNASWESPASDGGYEIIGFDIDLSSDGVSWSTVASASADTRTVTFASSSGQPLIDQEYRVRVRARTSFGRGTASDVVSINPFSTDAGRRGSEVSEPEVSPESGEAAGVLSAAASESEQRRSIMAVGGVPGRVVSPVATPTNGGASIAWSPPTDIGSGSITGYTVQSSVDGATWTTVSAAATSPFAVSSLTPGAQYQYRVFASNASGAGTPTTVIFTAGGSTSGNFASAPGSSSPSAGTIPESGSDNSVSYDASVQADLPTGYWRLNDAVGSSTAVGSGSTTSTGAVTAVTFGVTGPVGTGASFNGTTSRILVADNTTWQTPSLTAEAWIRPGTQTSSFSTVVARADSGTARNWHLDVTQAGQLFAWVGGTTVISASGLIQANVWQHVALTFDGSNVRLYWNGALVGSTATVGVDVSSVPAPISIGARNTTASNFFTGSISNVAVYGSALPASRIQTHVQAGGLAANTVTTPSVVVGDNSATLTWTAPTFVTGTVTGYEIQSAPRVTGGLSSNTSVWTTVDASTSTSTALTRTITGLAANTGYSFRLRALTTAGPGAWSIPVDAFVSATPLAPTNLTAATTSSTELTLSWTAPTLTTNGSAVQTILGYRID
ncbi:MAG: hypothetical protein RLZ19_330, partial [Actinomycetota bacterium]